jgi:hypothetical protein
MRVHTRSAGHEFLVFLLVVATRTKRCSVFVVWGFIRSLRVCAGWFGYGIRLAGHCTNACLVRFVLHRVCTGGRWSRPLLYTTPICTFPDSSACSLVLQNFPCREVSVTT